MPSLAPSAPLCVVFDVDDTLYLERDYVRSGFLTVGQWLLERHGLPGFANLAWELFLEGHRGTIFDRVLETLHANPALVPTLVDVYRAHVPVIELLPDARALLRQAQSRGPMAAITDGPAQCQWAKVRALGVTSCCNPVLITADLGAGMGKPHPHAYELVQRATGFEGARCVYIGDNPNKDFVAPRALGWRTLRVRRPEGLHYSLPSGADVDHEVSNLDHAAAWLWGTP